MEYIDIGAFPNNQSIGASSPATVGGTGTTPQLYGGATTAVALSIPGSNRYNGQEMHVRLAGSVFPGVASNVKLTVYANYPSYPNGAAQYPTVSVTSASMTNNVALYNVAAHTFVVGQFVTVTPVANTDIQGTVGPITAVNATSFSAANINGATLAEANIANAAQTATAAIAPIPLYNAVASPTLTVNVNAPFGAAMTLLGDSSSGVLTIIGGTDVTVNANGTALVPNTSTGTVSPVPGVNFQLEPVINLTVAHTFGASNANNAGRLRMFTLEG